MASDRKDPFRDCRFLVEMDGITQAGFQEVTIPDSTTDPIEYRTGDGPTTMTKIPGLTKYGNVILKWGTTDSMEIYEWRKAVEEGKIKKCRKNVAVVGLDEEGKPCARWEFSQAWPTKYDGPDYNSAGTGCAFETLELAHEGCIRAQ